MNVPNLAISMGGAAKGQGVPHGRRSHADLDSLGADEPLFLDDAPESSRQSVNAADHDADDDDKARPADASQNSFPLPGGTPVLLGLVQPTPSPDATGRSALAQTQGTTPDSTAVVAGQASTEEWVPAGTDSGGLATRLRALTLSTAPRLFRVNLGAEQATSEAMPVAAGAAQIETQGQSDQTVSLPTGGSAPPSDQQLAPIVAVSEDLPDPTANTSSLHDPAADDTPDASTASSTEPLTRGEHAGSEAQPVDGAVTALDAASASATVTASEHSANGIAPTAQALPLEASQTILSELALAVKGLVAGNAATSDVRIDSTSLGSVDVRLTPSESGETLQISCGNPAVAAVVQDGLSALRALLGQAGMGDVSVRLTSDALEPVGASVAPDSGDRPLASGGRRSADGNAEGESATRPALPKHETDTAVVVPVAGQPAPTEHPIDASVAPSGLGERQLSARQQNEILDQVVRAAAQAATSHQESTRIDLNPPNLGRLELRMAIEDGRAHIHIVAENPETRDALATALPQLREALKEQGLVADRLSVSMGFGFDGSSWQSPSTNQTPWRQGRAVPVDREPQPAAAVAVEAERGRERMRVGAGIVDLYA